MQSTSKRKYTPRAQVEAVCQHCGASYSTSTPWLAKFCGSRCADKARYERDRGKRLKAVQEYRQRLGPEIARRNRERRRADPEKARRANRDSYLRHRAKRLAEAREYQKAHPEVVAATRLKRNGAPTKRITTRDMARALARARGECTYCGIKLLGLGRSDPKSLQWDHVIPLSRGGHNTIGNLVPSCRSCNSSKRAMLIMEWRARESRRG